MLGKFLPVFFVQSLPSLFFRHYCHAWETLWQCWLRIGKGQYGTHVFETTLKQTRISLRRWQDQELGTRLCLWSRWSDGRALFGGASGRRDLSRKVLAQVRFSGHRCDRSTLRLWVCHSWSSLKVDKDTFCRLRLCFWTVQLGSEEALVHLKQDTFMEHWSVQTHAKLNDFTDGKWLVGRATN